MKLTRQDKVMVLRNFAQYTARHEYGAKFTPAVDAVLQF